MLACKTAFECFWERRDRLPSFQRARHFRSDRRIGWTAVDGYRRSSIGGIDHIDIMNEY